MSTDHKVAPSTQQTTSQGNKLQTSVTLSAQPPTPLRRTDQRPPTRVPRLTLPISYLARPSLLLPALALLLQTGCRTHSPAARLPTCSTVSPSKRVSHIAVPVAVDQSELKKTIAARLAALLDDTELSEERYGCQVTYHQGRVKGVDLRSDNGALEVAAEFSSEFSASLGPLSVPITLDGTAGLRVEPSLGTNWNIALHAKPFCDVSDVHIASLPASFVPWLRQWLTRQASEFLESEVESLETQIAESDLLRNEAKVRMREFVQGVEVSDSPPLWLQVEPLSFHQPIFTVQSGRLICWLGSDAIITTSIARPDRPAVEHLPPILKGSAANTLKINASVTGNLDEWGTILRSQVQGTEFEPYPGTLLRITDASLESSTPGIAVRLQFETRGFWKSKGDVVLTATPKYDTRTHEIYLDDLDYDLHTSHVPAKLVSWLLHGPIRRQIAAAARYDISGELREYKSLLNESAKDYPLADGVSLRVHVSQFEVEAIHAEGRKLIVLFLLNGDGEVVITALDTF